MIRYNRIQLAALVAILAILETFGLSGITVLMATH